MGKIKKTFQEINEKIARKEAVVLTAEEVIALKEEQGVKKAAEIVDVVTTGTFGPMCSSGAFLNVGHSDPPIRMQKVWLNGVMAYAGLAAVDMYLGATQESELEKSYGGAHVIEAFIKGKKIKLKALSSGTDCYPAQQVEAWISKETVNQAFMLNPRNSYQNYNVAVNQSDKKIYTYMGILLPDLGNASYSTSGQLSPLLNDPDLRTIGLGTRIFMGGTEGYVAWEGTQFSPQFIQGNKENEIIRKGCTLALVGDLKKMDPNFVQAAYFAGYGVSLFMGIGIPIPVLDEDMLRAVSIKDEEIWTEIIDYSFPHRDKPSLGKINYAQLRTGQIELNGKKIPTSSMSSYAKARIIAGKLKESILAGSFFLQEPIEHFPAKQDFKPLKTTRIQ